ncbi:MAG: hypothetical protein VW450_08640 [Chloroflexota bacterium]
MRVRKSLGLALLTLALAGLLAACGGETPTATPTATPKPADNGGTTAATPTPEPAFDLAAQFKGKTIRIMANSNPGGGTDAQGRFMATFLSQYIPGNPRFIVSNNGNKDGEYDYAATRAPKDGTYWSWTSTPELERGHRDGAVKRSEFRFLWTQAPRNVQTLTYGSKYDCAWDASGSSEAFFSFADEIADVEAGGATILANVTYMEDLRVPIIYKAVASATTADVLLMWERGDINSTSRNSLWYQLPTTRTGWVADGTVRMVADMGFTPAQPNAESDPHCGQVRDKMTAEGIEKLNGFFNPSTYVGKSLWLPPGVDEELWVALGETLKATFSNPEVAKKMEDFTGQAMNEQMYYKEGQELTVITDPAYAKAISLIDAESARIREKYFGL